MTGPDIPDLEVGPGQYKVVNNMTDQHEGRVFNKPGAVPRWVVGAVCGHYETYKTGLKRWVAFKEWRKKMEWTEDADMTITLKSSMT